MALNYTKIQTYRTGGAIITNGLTMQYPESSNLGYNCTAYDGTDVIASGHHTKYKVNQSNSTISKTYEHRGTVELSIIESVSTPSKTGNAFTIDKANVNNIEFNSNFTTLRAKDINVSGYGDTAYLSYIPGSVWSNSSSGVNVKEGDFNSLSNYMDLAGGDNMPMYKGQTFDGYSLPTGLVPIASDVEFKDGICTSFYDICRQTPLPVFAKVTVYNYNLGYDATIDFWVRISSPTMTTPSCFNATRYDDEYITNTQFIHSSDEGTVDNGSSKTIYIPLKGYATYLTSKSFIGKIYLCDAGDYYTITKNSVTPMFVEDVNKTDINIEWPANLGYADTPYSYNSFDFIQRPNGSCWIYDLGSVYLGTNTYTKYIKFTPMYGNSETPAGITVYTNSSLTTSLGSLDWQSSSDYLTKESNTSASETLYYRAVSHFGTTATGTCIATTNTAYTTTIQLKQTTTVTYSATAYGGNNLTEFRQYNSGYETFSDTVQVATFHTPSAGNVAFSMGNPEGDGYWNFDIELTANTQTSANVQISVLLRKTGTSTTIELGEEHYEFGYTTWDSYNTDMSLCTATLNGNTSYEIMIEVNGWMIRDSNTNWGYSEVDVKMSNAGANTIYLTYNN